MERRIRQLGLSIVQNDDCRFAGGYVEALWLIYRKNPRIFQPPIKMPRSSRVVAFAGNTVAKLVSSLSIKDIRFDVSSGVAQMMLSHKVSTCHSRSYCKPKFEISQCPDVSSLGATRL